MRINHLAEDSMIQFLSFASLPLIPCSTVEVLATLTSDVGRILSKMHLVQPKGDINFITGVRIAHVSSDIKDSDFFLFRCVMWIQSKSKYEIIA